MVERMALDALSSHVEATIARSDELMLLAKYDEALAMLESLANDSPCNVAHNQAIFRATARVLLHKGYPQQAKAAMYKACDLPLDGMNQQQVLILRIHAAFVIIVGCGEAYQDEDVLHQGRELLSPLRALSSYNSDAVCPVQFHIARYLTDTATNATD